MTENKLIGRGWTFPVGPDGSGGIGLSSDHNEIAESIRLIIGTSLGERVMRPDFGCRIHELIFHPLIGETLGLCQRYVEEAIGWWEPRIDLREVNVTPDPLDADLGKLLIRLRYSVKGTKDERSLVYPFYLIREE
jgi:phage baseplate assembly protein W